MKLMTYNIYNGAPDTLDLIVSVVNEQNPDFLCLNEANGFDLDDNKKLRQFARLTGFDHFQLEKCGDGYDYHVAVLSKLPIKNIQAVHPVSRAVILTTVNTELGEITICATHLSPNSEQTRLEEVRLIIDALQAKEKSVVMGDLNSLSESDNYADDFVKTFNAGQMRKFTDEHKILYEVIGTFEAAGYIDSGVKFNRQADYTAPTEVNTDAEHSDMRLDYILASSSLATNLKDYYVVKNDTTNRASDHFPVVVELS